jgi:integrase
MAAKLEKTRTPGIFKRGSRYVFSYRVDGRQRWESARTLDEARRLKSERTTDAARGDLEERSAITLHEYAREWVERYQGTGKRGFREETRSEYRGLLDRYALRHFAKGTPVSKIGPREIAGFIAWLVKQPNGRKGCLSDKSVRNALGPLAACLATAKREGLIRDNPAMGAALPHRPRIEEDDEQPRPFPRVDGTETMELVVQLIHPDHRPMFKLLAATGLRRSELLALEIRHLHLTGEAPHVKVRQRTRWQKGKGQVLGPLKSRHARRDLPISLELADELRAHLAGRQPGDLAFAGMAGRPYDPHHLHLRVLGPACAEAAVTWAGFHTFRHTIASRMFASGRNAVQVQHWLGHHSAAFTLSTYVHLLDGDLGGPVVPHLAREESANKVQTDPTPQDDIQPTRVLAETAD